MGPRDSRASLPLQRCANLLSSGRARRPGDQLPHQAFSPQGTGHLGGAQKDTSIQVPIQLPAPPGPTVPRGQARHIPSGIHRPERCHRASGLKDARSSEGPAPRAAGREPAALGPAPTPTSHAAVRPRWPLAGGGTLEGQRHLERVGVWYRLEGEASGSKPGGRKVLAHGRNGFITAWSTDPCAPEAPSGGNYARAALDIYPRGQGSVPAQTVPSGPRRPKPRPGFPRRLGPGHAVNTAARWPVGELNGAGAPLDSKPDCCPEGGAVELVGLRTLGRPRGSSVLRGFPRPPCPTPSSGPGGDRDGRQMCR